MRHRLRYNYAADHHFVALSSPTGQGSEANAGWSHEIAVESSRDYWKSAWFSGTCKWNKP